MVAIVLLAVSLAALFVASTSLSAVTGASFVGYEGDDGRLRGAQGPVMGPYLCHYYHTYPHTV
jgi:hypothetical protein